MDTRNNYNSLPTSKRTGQDWAASDWTEIGSEIKKIKKIVHMHEA